MRDAHTRIEIVPSHKKLKSEFVDVTTTYVPMHNVLRIDAVKSRGPQNIPISRYRCGVF
ncbi:DUF1820 family protein [Alteromonas lipotrueiana]|uniref:DUF1820 family protein n=1 Tax=Alteromonas lipotrueiana TaxID=2803815 RepID=UPI003CCED93A